MTSGVPCLIELCESMFVITAERLLTSLGSSTLHSDLTPEVTSLSAAYRSRSEGNQSR